MNQLDYDPERDKVGSGAVSGAVAPPALTMPEEHVSKEGWLAGESDSTKSFWTICKKNPLEATVACVVVLCVALAFLWALRPSAAAVNDVPAKPAKEAAKPTLSGETADTPPHRAGQNPKTAPTQNQRQARSEEIIETDTASANRPADVAEKPSAMVANPAIPLTARQQAYEARAVSRLNQVTQPKPEK